MHYANFHILNNRFLGVLAANVVKDLKKDLR